MAELHNTVMGKRLIEHTLPEIARQLERIADALEGKDKTPEQIRSAYLSHLTSGQPDSEIVKQLRDIWVK
jgi:hypothetical protein